MGPKSPHPWFRDPKTWLLIAGFFGVTSLGTLISKGQTLIGHLARPAIQQADSSNRAATREMFIEFRDTILAVQRRDHAQAMQEIEKTQRLVERLPGAKRAGEQIRRERENRRTVWNSLKGETVQ